MAFKFDKEKYARYSMVMNKAPGSVDYGSTQLGIAMKKAVATINDREKAGKMKAANASAYKARVDGLKPLIGVDEDTGLLQVAQMIGAINRSL